MLACGIADTRPGWRQVPAIPGKADLDPLLADGPDRVVVHGTDADLAAVVLRLLRTDRLADVAVGFVPVQPKGSHVARLWRLPAGAVDFALAAEPVRLPLVRDDAGGVLVGLGRIGPVEGEAYCDDQLALRGRATAIEVTPDRAGVCGRVLTGPFRRARSYRGRAFQVGCHPTTVTRDGVEHPRPVPRWTWYRHTEDLRAVAQIANCQPVSA
jgi:hypothetical protein